MTATPADQFMPANVTVNVGEKVTWTNAGGSHNVRFEDGLFTVPGSAVPPSGWPAVVSRTFNAPGVLRYYCDLHGDPGGVGMSGTVTVNAASPSPAPPPPGSPPPGSPPPGSPPPGSPPPGSPPPGGSDPGAPTPPLTPFKVTLRVSDVTPARAGNVRFFGFVRPARDGGIVLIQRRAPTGRYRTAARARLRDAGEAQSKYSVRVRVARSGVYRARVLGDQDHGPGTSRTRRLVVR